MNRNIKTKAKSIIKGMPYISKAIIFGGILICTILFGAAFIATGKTSGDWIDLQNAVVTQRTIVEYYLVCVVECLLFGYAAHYIDARS